MLHLKGAPFDPPISTSAIDILPGQEHLSAFTGHTNHEISGLADLHDDPAEALIWDLRALDAAHALTDERAQQHHASLHVAGFYPSLHLNIADDLRRLASFDAADEYIQDAERHAFALSEDAYGNTIRTAIHEVHKAIDNRDTARRTSATGAAR